MRAFSPPTIRVLHGATLAALLVRCSSEAPPSDGSAGASAGGTAGAAAAGAAGSAGARAGGAGRGMAGATVAGSNTGGSTAGATASAGAAGGGAPAAGQGGAPGSAGSAAGASPAGAPSGGKGGQGGVTGGAGGPAGGTGAGAAGASAGSGGAAVGSCKGGNFLICEDFEGASIPAGWTARGMVSIATDQAKRGMRSLKIGQAANGERRITRDAAGLGAAHWGRIFYRVESPTPAVFVHSTLVALEGNGPDIGVAEFRVVDTVQDANRMHQFLWNVQPSGAEYGKGSAYNWRFDGEWHCAEWYVDGGTQAYRFFIDGMEITAIAIANGAGNNGSGQDRTHIPMGFTQLRVGWNNYQSASPGFVAWFDELAIATMRVGCD